MTWLVAGWANPSRSCCGHAPDGHSTSIPRGLRQIAAAGFALFLAILESLDAKWPPATFLEPSGAIPEPVPLAGLLVNAEYSALRCGKRPIQTV
jgi:hypothetical protein